MANLSATLSDVNDVSRVVEAPAQASGLATALGSLAKGLDTVNDTFNQRAASKRQAAAEARAQADQAMQVERFQREKQGWGAADYAALAANELNTAANGATTVENVPTTFDAEDPNVSSFMGDMSGQVKSMQVSVQQGKMPSIALNGLANKLFNAGLQRGIPAGVLAKAFKEQGLDAFHAYDASMEDQSAQEKAVREEKANAYKAGLEARPDAAESQLTEDEIVVIGRRQIAEAAKLDATIKNANLQSTLNSDARATNNDVREQSDSDATNIAVLAFNGGTGEMIEAALRTANPAFAPERGSDTTYEMKQAKIAAGLPQYFEQVKQQTLNKMRQAQYSPEAVARASSAIDDRIKGVLDGMGAGGKAYAEAANLVGQSFNLRMREAAPLVYQMKSLGIDYSTQIDLMKTLDPKVKARLGSQLSGILSDGIVDSAEKTQFKNLLAVASGKANITDIDTAQGRRAVVGQANQFVASTTSKIAAGGGDPDTYMSMARQIALGAGSRSAADSSTDLYNATQALARNGVGDAVRKLISNSGTSEEARLLGSAQRSAAARLLQASKAKLGAVLQSGNDKYQELFYDPNAGAWGFRFRDKLWNADQKNVPGGYARPKPSGPSQEANQLLSAMNGNLAFLTKTGDFDDDSPKGSYREVAAYWATNKPTADMQKRAVAEKKRGSIYDVQDTVIEGLSKTPEIDIGGNNDIIGPEGTGKNPRSSAQGVGQFTNATWLATLRKHAPELIEGKTDADILSMRSNKALATKAVGWYRGDNASYLASRGLPSGRTATAVAHFAGPEGAAKLLSANPDAPVESVLGSAAVNANPHLRGKTAAQTLEWARSFYRA